MQAATTGAERILVVDDDPLNQRIFGATLKRAGFEVVGAYSGREALAFTARARPDLVLLDYQMPEMDGPEVLRRMRALPGMKDVPILMVTGSDSDEHIDAGFAAGAEDYLVKPIDPRILRARVASVLRARRDLRSARQAAHMTADLDEGREVQSAQLPRLPLGFAGWRASGAVVSSGAVGGDLFDIIEAGDGTWVAVLVDVCGHGVGAALVAAGIRAELRGLLRVHALADAFARLNDRLLDDHTPRYACIAAVALGRDHITIVNAGLPPVAISGGGAIRALVQATGVPPGLLPGQTYEGCSFHVGPGDRVALLSDGMTEPLGSADNVEVVGAGLGLFDPRQWCDADPLSARDHVMQWTAQAAELFLDDASVLLLEAHGAVDHPGRADVEAMASSPSGGPLRPASR